MLNNSYLKNISPGVLSLGGVSIRKQKLCSTHHPREEADRREVQRREPS